MGKSESPVGKSLPLVAFAERFPARKWIPVDRAVRQGARNEKADESVTVVHSTIHLPGLGR